MSQKITLNFKLILLGDSNTGKTAILNQYIYHTFTNTKATTGIDFFTKMFEIDDFIVKLNIFDTAGQERYLAMTKSYFRGTNAVLFTYSLTEKQSFLNIPLWIKKYQDQAGTDALKIAVGTKKDLLKQKLQEAKSQRKMSFPQRFDKDEMAKSPKKHEQNNKSQEFKQQTKSQSEQAESTNQKQSATISQQQMQTFLKSYGLAFSFQTSALLNQNIDEVFEQICKYLIVKQMNKNYSNNDTLNRSRVETQFSSSRRRSSGEEQKNLSLEQKNSSEDHKKGQTCC